MQKPPGAKDSDTAITIDTSFEKPLYGPEEVEAAVKKSDDQEQRTAPGQPQSDSRPVE
ncbi:MAG: hypothetical protein AAFR42_19250 [Cyanobacteria bacterium J06628_6]